MKSDKLKIVLFLSFLALPVSAAREFSRVNIGAKAAYVYDLKTGKTIFGRNEEAQLPLASLTKLMTVYAAHAQGVGDEKLSCLTLTTSSNEGARQIANSTSDGVATLNNYAQALGLHQTFYLNPTGLDVSATLAGAYGSARDQARLLSVLYKQFPALISCTSKPIGNTNPDITRTIGLVGSKTGLTDLAGGNLGIIFDAEIAHPIIIVVLGSSAEDRFIDVQTLIRATLVYFDRDI